MAFHLTPYAVVSAVTTLIASAVAVAAWPRRTVPGAIFLIWLMAASAEWSLGAALEYASMGIYAKVFWSKVEYVGALSAPVLFLLFTLEYNRLEHWLAPLRVTALFVIPLVTLGLAITNERHGLIWSGFSPSRNGDNLLIYHHGVGYWIGVVGYSYLIMLAGTCLLVWAVISFPLPYRRQAGALLVGAFVPWAGDLIYTLGRSPLQGLELTPLLLIGAGVGFAVSLFQFQLFDLVPVARGALIEMMTEGVLVLDVQGRILDINPAARRLLKLPSDLAPGGDIRGALAGWEKLVDILLTGQEGRVEMAPEGDDSAFWELNISPVHRRGGQRVDQLVLIQDITLRKRAEVELAALQIELRDQAIHDSLTQLFNRRYLDESLERELARTVHDFVPLSLVIMDIDYFKEINDRFGHKGGDELLRKFGKLLRERTRREDIPCRYGGEEFVVVLPRTGPVAAVSRVEAWRMEFEALSVPYNGGLLQATFSAGVASYPENGATADALLTAGDRALYAAKAAGRNRVMPG